LNFSIENSAAAPTCILSIFLSIIVDVVNAQKYKLRLTTANAQPSIVG